MPLTPCPRCSPCLSEPVTAREVDAEAEALIHALRAACQQAERVRLGYVRVNVAGGFKGPDYIDPIDLRAFENQLQGAWIALDELVELLDLHWSAASPPELRCSSRAPEHDGEEGA